ncbi:GTP pyrophosphokinase [Clostridium fallax]|uniref:RelA/SpoT domain-containing protein n=1 Tax=Clostridium fallax TaxID=1533 RepID=A0A1M4W8P4_9CLOT|nr:hypothetical protein [Clostridium fallax]SHE77631.1 hypothetical protein SAMN05443638_11112 [Clostridium fallax]SQB05951.1 RelA/SpoT domain-containing protein [Clostridium fallax]
MELKIFEFIDEVVNDLEESNEKFEYIANEIKIYFEEVLSHYGDGYLNINSRVKSTESLKEKILRNNYYKKFSSSKELFYNLSDLIGTRIECRFINDEKKIYHLIKNYFYKTNGDGFYYNPINKKIFLELAGKQPQLQKNGFEIYRIDGVYIDGEERVRFELQIKSLVNVFWGEIEHKIIYKNFNYMLTDNFLKQIMSSLKKNLAMIDNELLIIYEQFNRIDSEKTDIRKELIQGVLAKGIYDLFSERMKTSIGFVIDFKKSCETVMKYIFRSNYVTDVQEYTATLLNTLKRLNELSYDNVDFSQEIIFEREIEFEDDFSKIVGQTLLKSINEDFQWNLFFKILFHIEPGDNVEDFYSFILFFKDLFYTTEGAKSLIKAFGEDKGREISEGLLKELAICFKKVDSIEFIYDNNIESINECIINFINIIVNNVRDYNQWLQVKTIFFKLFRVNILTIFNEKVDKKIIKDLIEEIKYCPINMDIQKEFLNPLDRLDFLCELKDNEIESFFKVL